MYLHLELLVLVCYLLKIVSGCLWVGGPVTINIQSNCEAFADIDIQAIDNGVTTCTFSGQQENGVWAGNCIDGYNGVLEIMTGYATLEYITPHGNFFEDVTLYNSDCTTEVCNGDGFSYCTVTMFGEYFC